MKLSLFVFYALVHKDTRKLLLPTILKNQKILGKVKPQFSKNKDLLNTLFFK